jgi:hypothetical protein
MSAFFKGSLKVDQYYLANRIRALLLLGDKHLDAIIGMLLAADYSQRVFRKTNPMRGCRL